MAANDMELKVKIVPEMQDLKTKADTLRESVRAASGFEGDIGAKRAQRLNRVSNDISALLAKTELSSKELKQLNGLFQEFYEILGKAAATTKNVSAAMSELIKKQADALKARNEAAERRNAILSQGKLKDSGKSFQYLDTTAQKIKDMGGVYTRTASGELSKKVLTNYNTITSKDINTLYDKSGKPLAQSAAWQEIQDEIKSANGKLANATGELNKFEKALNEATAAVAAQAKKEKETNNGSTLGAEVSTAQVAASDTLNQLAEDTAKRQGQQSSAGLEVQTLEKQSSALGKAFKQFTIYAIAVRAARRALNEAKKTIQDLDKYLTEQAMVTGKTRQETYALLKEYQNLSKQLGATTKDVANVATQYMRQGKTTQDALTLTEAAISAAKVAGISASESVNYLTTALNGFQLSAQDAMAVSDKFAAIAATSATSYEEIATALSKVASQANLAGMSIDYTTALLAKGIETTREAPETIGTALKTIIARMRELTDYGETLEGDTDLNNVETQLAYVGIQLRNNNGDLRSTEDVLNDLGQKWDTLNSNQQAAVAKALAGTRQQSRLIAMMSDYERVTELQEIAQRSQGTTLAQMDTYLQGMDAALNKINVAWESIITNLTNSDVIIGLMNTFGGILDMVGQILNSTPGLIAAITTISLIGLTILNNKILENAVANRQKELSLERQKIDLKDQKIQADIFIQTNKQRILQDKITLAKYKQRIIDLKGKKVLDAAEQTELKELETYVAENEVRIEQEYTRLQNSQLISDTFEAQNSLLNAQSGLVGGLLSQFTSIFGILAVIKTLQSAWNAGMVAGNALHQKRLGLMTAEEAEQVKSNALAGAGMFAKVVAAFASLGPWGVVAGVAIGAALAAAIGVGIAASVGAFNAPKDKAAEQINDLSVEILNLSKKSQAIDTAISKFEDLDNQLIKTKKDTEAMAEALDSAADKLSSDKDSNTKGLNLNGKSEQEYYQSLQTTHEKRSFLQRVNELTQQQMEKNRQEQLNTVAKLRARGGQDWSDFKTDASYAQSRDAIYAIAINNVYKATDELQRQNNLFTSAAAASANTVLSDIINNINDFDQVMSYAEDGGKKLAQLASHLADIQLDGVNATTILTSEDYSLKEQVQAYQSIANSLEQVDQVALDAFKDMYQQYEVFLNLGDEVLDFIEKTHMSTDAINKLYKGYEQLQAVGLDISQEEYEKRFTTYLSALADLNGDVAAATHAVFDDLLATTEDYTKAWNQLINNFGNAVQVGVLNMGQNIDKLKNQINSIYDSAMKWNTMTETERTQFLSDHADLFSGTDGQALLRAFETGNYQIIEQALKSNEVLSEKMKQQREALEQELKIELAREGDAYNAAYVQYLQDQIKYFNDERKLYQANLDLRLEQENNAIDQYKELLQKEHDALTESLEKRKDAYQKYFDAVNQAQEDESYEEEANTLINNMAKLSSSSDANSQKQVKEMSQQLADLEKERLQTLRERAQEQIISNMENELSQINDKFDKLLDNSRALLAQLQGEDAASLVAREIMQANTSGLTTTGFEDFLANLQTRYGNILSGIDWDAIQPARVDNNNNLVLNVNGQEIILGQGDQQLVMEAVANALRQIGSR